MIKQTKNNLIFIGSVLLILILFVFAEIKLESYVKYLFSENNLIFLTLIIPLGLYILKKLEKKLNKTLYDSSASKKYFKDQKDYGEKKWYHGKCYNCKNNSLTELVEEDVPIGKKLTCTECGSINKKTIPRSIFLIPLSIYGVFELFDILEVYQFQLLISLLLLTIISQAITGYLWVNTNWENIGGRSD